MRTIIGLPCYNEAENLDELIENIIKHNDDVILFFVDDGSIDSSVSIIEKYIKMYPFIYLIKHDKNMGLGCAMNTILNHASEAYNEDDVLVTFDSDNTHPPSIIPEMIKKLKNENLDIVIASRFAKGGEETGLSPARKFYSRGAFLFCKLLFNIKNVRDYSCGFRAYKIGVIKKLKNRYKNNIVEASGFECMLEILIKCRNARIGEYPLRLNYALKKGDSKMKPIKTIKGYFRLAAKTGGVHS